MYLNIGESKPPNSGEDPPPLPPRFRKVKDEECKGLLATGPHVTLAFTDVDQDRDLDLVLLADRQPPALGINDRLLRRMNRRVTRAETEELLGKLRSAIPGSSRRPC